MIPETKPNLDDPNTWSDRPLSTIIGFTFPSEIQGGWTIPLESAAFLDVQPEPTGFTAIGMVALSLNPPSEVLTNTSQSRGIFSFASSHSSTTAPTLVQHVGYVIEYIKGQSITIVDRNGIKFKFALDPQLKIVPAKRASLLEKDRPLYVTVIAPANSPNNKMVAVGIVIHPGIPNGFPTPTPTFTPTNTPTMTPTVVTSTPTPTGTSPTNTPTPTGTSPTNTPTPTGTAPTDTPTPTSTPGGGAIVLDKFIVEVDLISTEDTVAGDLVPVTGTGTPIPLTFQRIPQIVNPQREEAIYPEFQLDSAPSNTSTIASDSVCFVIDATGDGFIRYCSADPVLLSVKDSFPTQYTELQNMMIAAAAHIGYTAPLALDQTLSTIEDGQRIQDCANATDELTQQTACASDIVLVPVTSDYFDEKYEALLDALDDGPSVSVPAPIDIAVVKVLQPIEFPSTNPVTTVLVQPGDYRVEFWFDENGAVYAATLTGLTTDDILVINQQIPAIPPIFIRASGPQQPFAQISGFDLKICCFGRECK